MRWKDDCTYSCGNEFFRFPSPTYDAEQADGTAYPPDCATTGLPSNAMIIDDVPTGTPPVRTGCSNSGWSHRGSDDSRRPECGTDGHAYKQGSAQPLLRHSFMPSQYLHRNGRAAKLLGERSGLAGPVHDGNSEKCSGPTADAAANDTPYGPCGTTGNLHGGNPWGIGYLVWDPGVDPATGHFCSDPNRRPDPQYSN
ncbi:hypothetical protein [Streptomyces sp. NPDC057877]|uniref:hypothetical protein n=1 Tax=Streptomyces sp. NPDC057877 TaxID=3346269 RepID=UPI0036B512D9